MNCSCIIVASCYFGLTIGVMAPNNTDNTDGIEATDKTQPTTGIIAGLVFPWARLEAELRWHRDTLHGYNPPDLPGEPGEQSAEGNVNTVALLGNVRLQPVWRFSPYLLGGIGPAY